MSEISALLDIDLYEWNQHEMTTENTINIDIMHEFVLRNRKTIVIN